MGRKSRAIWAWAALGAIGVATGLLLASEPGAYAFVPPCPTHEHLGVHCPGCGSLRATHHLLNGRIGESVRHHALVLPLGVPLGAALVVGLGSTALGRRMPVLRRFRSAGWWVLGALIVFTLARNLPLESLDVLRPPERAAPGTP